MCVCVRMCVVEFKEIPSLSGGVFSPLILSSFHSMFSAKLNAKVRNLEVFMA